MNWYLEVLRHRYAKFAGRAGREEFWTYTLVSLFVSLILSVLPRFIGLPGLILSFLYAFGVMIPNFSVSARRLHDVNKSAWWMLIAIIPLIGTIWLIVLYATEGTRGPNRFGEDPKGVVQADATVSLPG